MKLYLNCTAVCFLIAILAFPIGLKLDQILIRHSERWNLNWSNLRDWVILKKPNAGVAIFILSGTIKCSIKKNSRDVRLYNLYKYIWTLNYKKLAIMSFLCLYHMLPKIFCPHHLEIEFFFLLLVIQFEMIYLVV